MTYNDQIKVLRSHIDTRNGQRIECNKQVEALTTHAVLLKSDLNDVEQAIEIVQRVAEQTQSQLEYQLSDLVSLAMSSVFDDPYTMSIDFKSKRGRTEISFLFERDGDVIDPLTAAAGGSVDVASFALRIALWCIQQPRTRNVLILDEPFKFLSDDLQERASAMLSDLSERTDMQMIIVSHEQRIIQDADKVLRLTKTRKTSALSLS